MKEPLLTTQSLPAHRILVVVQCGMFVALAVVVGQLLAIVPNVELVTLIVFIAGARLGGLGGTSVAVATVLYHNYFNPMGPAPLPIAVAQGMGWMVTACGGALIRGQKTKPLSWWRLAIAGVGLTLFFDVCTNISCLLVSADWSQAATVGALLVAGVSLSLLHIVSNAVAFALLTEPILETLARFDVRS